MQSITQSSNKIMHKIKNKINKSYTILQSECEYHWKAHSDSWLVSKYKLEPRTDEYTSKQLITGNNHFSTLASN